MGRSPGGLGVPEQPLWRRPEIAIRQSVAQPPRTPESLHGEQKIEAETGQAWWASL